MIAQLDFHFVMLTLLLEIFDPCFSSLSLVYIEAVDIGVGQILSPQFHQLSLWMLVSLYLLSLLSVEARCMAWTQWLLDIALRLQYGILSLNVNLRCLGDSLIELSHNNLLILYLRRRNASLVDVVAQGLDLWSLDYLISLEFAWLYSWTYQGLLGLLLLGSCLGWACERRHYGLI